jgi:hypothetical protein
MSRGGLQDDCIFCFSRLKVNQCQLPHGLVTSYIVPDDEIERIMQITEIHASYGMQALETNLKFTNSVNEYEHTRSWTIMTDSETQTDENAQLETTKQKELINDETASQKEESQISNKIKPDEESQKEKASKRQEDKEGTKKYRHESQQTTTTNGSFAAISKLFKNEGDTITETVIERSTNEGHSSQEETPKAETTLTREQIEHLTDDMTRTLIYASQSDAKFSQVKVTMWLQAMDKELQLLRSIGKNYTKSMLTDLRHPNFLAKEIIAGHTEDDFTQWESGQRIHKHEFCILNAKTLSTVILNADRIRLIDELVKFNSSILDAYESNQPLITKICQLLQSKLTMRKSGQAYGWFITRRRRLQNEQKHETEMSETQNRASLLDYQVHSSTKPVKLDNQTEHKCPAIDEELLKFISTKIKSIATKVAEDYEGELPNLKVEDDFTSILTKLAQEFIKHNKGWKNKTSLTSIEHLKRVEIYCGLRIREGERTKVLILLTRTLDKAREEIRKNN